MRVLTIGSDRALFTPSRAARRIAAYGRVFRQLLIVVLTRRGFEERELAPNVKAFPTNSSSRFVYIRDAYRLACKIITSLSETERKDLVVSAQDPFESGLAAWLVARHFRLPLQMQIHTDFASSHFRRESWLNFLRYLLARFLIPRARCIRVVSARIKRSLVSLGIPEGNISVLPIWSDLAPVERKEHTLFTILMVSRLTKEKNIGMALKAFRTLCGSGAPAELVIVGDGPLQNEFEIEAHSLGLNERVRFIGWQENPGSWYAKADAFLVTSDYEGWNIAAFDAVRAGIPVVMTDVGLAGEVVINGQNGLVVPVGDTDAIAEALLKLYRKEIHLVPRPIRTLSFEQYLEQYRNAMQQCRL